MSFFDPTVDILASAYNNNKKKKEEEKRTGQTEGD